MSIVKPKYSTIIPTYNRAQSLLETLDSVVNQTIPSYQYEILIINDGSTDNTKDIVLNFQKKYPNHNIRYFYEQNGGPAKARNLGIKESKGKIIFFTDDDCIVPPNWMETLIDGFNRHLDIVGVGGWYEPANKKLSGRYFQRYLDYFDRRHTIGMMDSEVKSNLFRDNLAGNTANMAYKKSTLEEVGGFDENLYFAGAVDWELKKNVQNRGYHLLYLPFMVSHLKDFNIKSFFKRSFNQGRGRYYMSLKYPNLPSKYNFNFINFFRHLIPYASIEKKFFFASFINALGLLMGRCHAKYIKPFKNIKNIREFKKPNIEIFSVETKNVKNNKIVITKFRKFNGGKIFPPKADSPHFLSVVIPTYNRSQGLINALKHLTNQTIPKNNYEIIVINDGSTDNTREVVAEFQKQHSDYDIKYFYQKNGGPAKARNLGIKESKGKIIFFTDDDCIVPPNWMETLIDGFRRYPETVGVGGWLEPSDEEVKRSAASRYFKLMHTGFQREYEILSNNPMRYFSVGAFNTANIAYKKEIIENVGGFNAKFYWPGSEDNDLAFRITLSGHYLLYIPFHVIHPKDLDLFSFLKTHFKRGANGYLFCRMHQSTLEKLRPGFVKDFGSINRSIIGPTPFLSGQDKFFAFLEWLGLNAGIRYMKNRLTERNEPVPPKPAAKISNY